MCLPHHDLTRPDTRPHHDVGELQQVEYVPLVCVGVGVVLPHHGLAPSLLPVDVVLTAAAARHCQASHLVC